MRGDGLLDFAGLLRIGAQSGRRRQSSRSRGADRSESGGPGSTA